MDTSQALRRCGDRIESWDDDPDFADLDLKLTHTSTSSPKSPKGNMRSNFDNHNRDRRESISSRMSVQSSTYEFESPDSWDHERQVLLDDSPATAIASAINAGIPIPENVPSSALIGGTIKRLGTKKAKRIAAHDDWGEDLELPMSGMALKVREQERHEFPDSLQQILAGSCSRNTSPSRGTLAPVLTASSQLNKFREIPEDDDFFFGDSDDLPTLKVPPARHMLRQQTSTASLLMTPPLSESATRGSPSVDDDFENDFEFPADAPLQLNIKLGDNPRGPIIHGLDNDFEEWTEGSSLGTRFGGSGRERGMSGGAMSIISPSVSSVTAESEDEAPLDGLELPTGPLPNFHEILEKRKHASFSMDTEMTDAPSAVKPKASKEDFLEGIEIGDGEVFDAKKLTLNRNVKHKQPTRKTSPVRRSAMSLTFTTNKAPANTLPPGIGGPGNRLRHGHPTLAPPIPILEPVVERERENQNPIVSKRPEQRNRWSNNSGTADRWSAKSEAIPANIPPPPPIPHSRFFADRQRQIGNKGSLRTLKAPNQQENTAPTTTNAQLLRMKRSMPNIGRAAASPSKPNSTVRSPSRNSGGRPASRSSAGRPPSSAGGRPPSSAGGRSTTTTTGRNESARSKTPGERKPAPFLPAGGTVRQSHHISAKISQQTFEYKEKIAAERRANSRHQQRTPHHSPSSSTASARTKRGTPTIAPEPLRRQAAAIETLKQPTRKRNFGDGTELEIFDDLPTSAKAENRFVVTPVGRGAPKAVKSQSVPITRTADRDGESPKKKIDLSRDLSSRFAEVPRFARDTNASRNAREQRIGISNTSTGYTGINQWKQHVAARGNVSPKSRRKPQLKPQLIKPMGNISNPPKAAAAVNGMTYNPKTFRWEGNENEVRGFEAEKHPTPPRPALISNVNHSGSKLGIQVVGGMVFDPASMSWLKVDEDPEEDEHDPFEGFDDLMDQDMLSIDGFSGGGADSGIGPIFSGRSAEGSRSGRLSGGFGEFVVGEEFDVGPEFVRRQREEEDRWRKKVDGWISTGEATKIENRWAIRELLAEHR